MSVTTNIRAGDEIAYRTVRREGREAFLADKTADDNPHQSRRGKGIERTQWFVGWYDAKYERFYDPEYGKVEDGEGEK